MNEEVKAARPEAGRSPWPVEAEVFVLGGRGSGELRATSMSMHVNKYGVESLAFRLVAAVLAGFRWLHAAAERADAHLERRRVAAAALRDFATMSDRELRDVGLTRADVHRVAWSASEPHASLTTDPNTGNS